MPPPLLPPLSPEHAFHFDNSWAERLGAGFHVPWQAARFPAPQVLRFNTALAEALGLPSGVDWYSPEAAQVLVANRVPQGAAPLAQAYAGHQFGGFSPQLGDGRALLVGELLDRHGQRRDLHLKGSGPTPFSRRGDGKAVLGPVLREYLMGEAMHALGIPTSRALAVVSTGETVRRDLPLPGAVLVRVASSHVRVGTFQFHAARGDTARVQQLLDYCLARHDPEVLAQGHERPALAWLCAVRDRQAALVAAWMRVGFIHGVMNTDNMMVSGETLDYGPCAFMDRYDPDTVFSSIDLHGRYAWGQQPGIAGWNLARLAETLLPLIDPDEERAVTLATEAVNGFHAQYQQHWQAVLRARLGLSTAEPEDADLAQDFLALLKRHAVDHTLAWRRLADAVEGQPHALRSLWAEPQALEAWLARWQSRLAREPGDTPAAHAADRAAAMRRVSPARIPRNHHVEAALQAAVMEGDLGPFDALLQALAQPYADQPEHAAYAEPAPVGGAPYVTFCGT